jgi:hypothetical protein
MVWRVKRIIGCPLGELEPMGDESLHKTNRGPRDQATRALLDHIAHILARGHAELSINNKKKSDEKKNNH